MRKHLVGFPPSCACPAHPTRTTETHLPRPRGCGRREKKHVDEPTPNDAAVGIHAARSTGMLASGLTTSEFTQIAPNYGEEEKVLENHFTELARQVSRDGPRGPFARQGRHVRIISFDGRGSPGKAGRSEERARGAAVEDGLPEADRGRLALEDGTSLPIHYTACTRSFPAGADGSNSRPCCGSDRIGRGGNAGVGARVFVFGNGCRSEGRGPIRDCRGLRYGWTCFEGFRCS